jgi:hypothetical protein
LSDRVVVEIAVIQNGHQHTGFILASDDAIPTAGRKSRKDKAPNAALCVPLLIGLKRTRTGRGVFYRTSGEIQSRITRVQTVFVVNRSLTRQIAESTAQHNTRVNNLGPKIRSRAFCRSDIKGQATETLAFPNTALTNNDRSRPRD